MPTCLCANGVAPLLRNVALSDVLSLFEATCGASSLPPVIDGDRVEPRPGVQLRLDGGDLVYEVDAVTPVQFPSEFESFLSAIASVSSAGWVSFEAVGEEEPTPRFRGPTAKAVAQVKATFCAVRLQAAQRAHQEALRELEAATAATEATARRPH